ncbi:MAG: NUDIX domain-containing protein [Candidatus Roizmanbacteria bacterium]
MTPSPTITKREVIQVVTVFLKYKNKYLILHRSTLKKIDPDTLNGVGGKVDRGESAVDAGVRETMEETGYLLTPTDLVFSGVLSLYNGYTSDFIVTFFIAQVPDDRVPHGLHTDDGDLQWMTYADFTESSIKKCDDLNYIFEDIHKNNKFIGSALFNDEMKVVTFAKHYLNL